MSERWLDITDIPAEGREFVFDDQELWAEGWREFKMDFTPAEPMQASFTVVPQPPRGVLVQGRLAGAVSAPCDRCTQPVNIGVAQDFDLFEEEAAPGEESLEPTLLRRQGRRLELDVTGMLWEEFLLALPVKPLCTEECKGLCPNCGKDLNTGPCDCGTSELDTRLAALRGLTIAKKEKS